MGFPKLKNPPTTRKTVTKFGGLDRRSEASLGSFAQMENMSQASYPALCSRRGRQVAHTGQDLGGLVAKDGLCRVEQGKFYINDYPVALGLTPGEKTMVSMGAYVVIFPDKKFVNTLDLTDFGDLEAEFVSDTDVVCTLCDATGGGYHYTLSPTAPEDPENGEYWLDSGVSPMVLRRFSAQSGVWTDIAGTYVKISAPGIGKGFAQYDGVEIAGFLPESLEALNGATTVWDRGEDYIVVPGILESAVTQGIADGAVKVGRYLPEMDFVIESGNRLWGCRYGLDRKGSIVNEIYASKLGDFKNFTCFMGLSTDSYTASVGTDGPFTGAITHLGYPLFFKENALHKVYGTYPAAYQIQATPCTGVGTGCGKSLAIVGNTLYYCAKRGIYGYDGSLPHKVSDPLGEMTCLSACGGAWGSKYYVSLTQADGKTHLLVYDTARGLWHREDDLQVSSFACHKEGFYALTDGKILNLNGGGEGVEWSVQTAPIGLHDPEQGYLTRLTARLTLAPGSVVSFAVSYDGGPWEPMGAFRGNRCRSFTLPVGCRRWDTMALKIWGQGEMTLHALTLTCEKGSELP